MSTYEELKGLKVKYLSSDTSGDRIQEGEIFYNSTGFALKSFVATQAFSAGTNLSTGRSQLAGSTSGTQSANFVVGGEIPSDSSLSDACEEYNGNGYSAGGDLGTARRKFAGGGTLTAGIVFGGAEQPNSGKTETYDGSSFSEVNDMNTARAQHAGVGTQTAALAAGGYDTARTGKTEEYNGTSWSEQNDMSIARSQLNSSAGTQTAMFIGGGNYKPGSLGYTRYSEEYDGTSWSSGGSLAVGKNGAFGFGSINVGVVAGGEISGGSHPTTTEIYDSTSFASSPATIANGRLSGTGAGAGSGLAGTTGIIQGGAPGGTPTEEFNTSILAVTAGAWASGGNLPAVNNGLSGAGVQTAALAFGSRTPGQTGETYEYDGSSWTASGDINYNAGNSAGLGTQTAAVSIGGGPGGASNNASSSYDGSSWTANNTLNGARSLAGGAGTSTAGLANGGFANPPGIVLNTSEHWDGTNWTTSGNMNTARMGCSSAGTQTNAVTFGGINYPAGTYYANSEDYNGSSWTNGPSMNAVRNMYNGGDGVAASAAWAIAGDASSNPLGSDTGHVELYNETVWVTQPSLATGRRSGASTKQGTSSSTLFFGGRDGSSDQTITEEFTGESTSLNLKTITDS